MKYSLIIIVLSFYLSVQAQETQLPSWITSKVYIDPTYAGTESGTFSAPYKSTKSVGFTWSKKHAFLFKRNTTLNLTINETISDDSIIIGAYGTGSRPILSYNVLSRALMVSGTGSSVNDIELIVPVNEDATGIAMSGSYGTINNCVVKGGNKGITGSGSAHLKIINTDVSGGIYDAIYIASVDTVTIFNCYIHDMVLLPDLTNQTSIDNIHTESSSIIFVDSLYSDHSNFPGKYCLIVNGADSVSVKNSTFIGHPGNGVVYPGSCVKGWFIDNCYFEGGLWGIQNNTSLHIYNSVFKGQIENAIYQGGDKWIYNCTFIDQYIPIRHWGFMIKELKNCIFYNFTNTLATNESLIESFSNNCFYSDHAANNYFHGDNYIEQDPLFLDYENGNYRLSAASPCINIGAAIPKTTVDITGIPRPQGAQLDLGAYEYIAGIPAVFNVSTDGSGCEKDTASISLSDSETGVDYTLYKNNVKLSTTFSGTGNVIDFGEQDQPGIYTVFANKRGTKLSNKMKGSPAVMTNPLPIKYYVLGGGYYNETIGGAEVTLSQSDTAIYYQLYNNNSAISSSIEGTGDSISFGIQSNEGIYTVIATNSKTGCSRKMPNYVLISRSNDILNPIIESFNISPNPSSGNFIIQFSKPNETVKQVCIYNMLGVKVFEKDIDKGQLEIQISLNIVPGEYILILKGTLVNYKPLKIVIK